MVLFFVCFGRKIEKVEKILFLVEKLEIIFLVEKIEKVDKNIFLVEKIEKQFFVEKNRKISKMQLLNGRTNLKKVWVKRNLFKRCLEQENFFLYFCIHTGDPA